MVDGNHDNKVSVETYKGGQEIEPLFYKRQALESIFDQLTQTDIQTVFFAYTLFLYILTRLGVFVIFIILLIRTRIIVRKGVYFLIIILNDF